MEWRGKIGGAVAIALVGGFFYYLWDQADRDREQRRAQKAEYDAKVKNEKDAIAKLLADPVATKAEIEKRLTSWIRAKGDFYLLEERSIVRTIPRTRTWSVRCEYGALTVEFPTISAEENDSALTTRLLPGKLDAQQCREYVEFVAERMSRLTQAR